MSTRRAGSLHNRAFPSHNRAVKLSAVLLAVCCWLSAASAQWIEKVIYLPDSLSGVIWPSCMACNPDAHKIYVSGRYDGRMRHGLDAYVVVLDARTAERAARIAVQENVAALCYNPVVQKLYASHTSIDRISAINGNSNIVTNTIPFDTAPSLLCANTVNGKMYVTSECQDRFLGLPDGIGDTVAGVRFCREQAVLRPGSV